MTYALNTEQVAERYGVSDQTVERWRKNGYLKGIKLPHGHWRYRPQDLEEFESNCLDRDYPLPTTSSTPTTANGTSDGQKIPRLDAYRLGKQLAKQQ